MRVQLKGRSEAVPPTDTETARAPQPAFPCDHDIDVQLGQPPSGRYRTEGLYFVLHRSPHRKSQNYIGQLARRL